MHFVCGKLFERLSTRSLWRRAVPPAGVMRKHKRRKFPTFAPVASRQRRNWGNVMSGGERGVISQCGTVSREGGGGILSFYERICATRDTGKFLNLHLTSFLMEMLYNVGSISLCNKCLQFWNIVRRDWSLDLLEVSVQFAGFADEVFIVRHPRLKIITIKIINLYSEEPLFENHKNDNNYGHLSLIRKLLSSSSSS